MKGMDVYNLTTDSADPDTNVPDLLWTSLDQFNIMAVQLDAIFELGDLPILPSYIPLVQLGIKSASIEYKLYNSKY